MKRVIHFLFRCAVSVLTLLSATKIVAQELFTMPKGAESAVSSFENLNGQKGQGGKSNSGAKGHAFESLNAGESKTLLYIKSAGIIQRMWFTIDERTPVMLRSLRLRMYWDGADKPAVDVPFGDFFCVGLGKPVAFQSALFTNPEGRSFNCYIPMPFKKGARVVLSNESDSNLNLLFFDIDFTRLTEPPKDMLYFHACWNRAIHSVPGKDFELLPSVAGRGRFLGVNVGVNVDSSYRRTWWGEGEVKFYIDGDSAYPTINGTGAEDYIGTGWGESSFAHLYQGCTIADGPKGLYAFYRFHIPDPIYFQDHFKATIQEMGGGFNGEVKSIKEKGVPMIPVSVSGDHEFTMLMQSPQSLTDSGFSKGWVNFYRVDDYSATAYFYLDKPISNLKELVSVKERIK
jgi:D-arabinan exo alpha-(1,3)/(1,5)-arabinofuranosidase (non-reducing end)